MKKGDSLVKAREVLEDIWDATPVHGRTWGLKKNSTDMRGSHITLMNQSQCVTVWELDKRVRVKGYGEGCLIDMVVSVLKSVGLEVSIEGGKKQCF